GLAGGVAPDLLDGDDLVAEVARLRLADDRATLVATLGDAVRDTGPASRMAIDELVAEIACAGDSERALECARHLTRAMHRRRGDTASRAAGLAMLARVVGWVRDRRSAELSLLRSDLLELARERVEVTASEVAPPDRLTSLMRAPNTGSDDLAPETAAALRLYGALLEGADSVEPDDLRRIAHALGEPDDAVRAAAEAALAALGPAATGELIATAAWGRRRARDRAVALLRDLPVTPGTLDRLVDAELDALDQTSAAVAVMTEPGDELIARRLDERLREIAHTVLLLVAAQQRSSAIERAAVAWRRAQHPVERARALAVIDAALPRALVKRLVETVDELAPLDRAAQLREAEVALPAREIVIRDELAGRDRLSRALVLHALGAAGRSAHRETIAEAARAEALAITPAELLRRVNDAVTEPQGDDMPSRVETLIALGRVPLLASLSTRQLADVSERARWTTVRAGGVVATSGDPIDALIVVEDGELAIGDRAIAKGEVVDELACVAPISASADLRAVRACRLIRLERVDFEELVDDVPGLAAAVCRALGALARR
ncbi:MAG TPA: cyclic nucleotide-binding domain-containing protein, partial [Kofleriaceae bacterium]